ncbi:MAG: hypothetical protein P4L99_21625 [Chthoniobacter sp.]|nr:hypothetical protein [Chthoniobacter sp.]
MSYGFISGHFPSQEQALTGGVAALTQWPVAFSKNDMAKIEWTWKTARINAAGILTLSGPVWGGPASYAFTMTASLTLDPDAVNWDDLVKGGPNVRNWIISALVDVPVAIPGGGFVTLAVSANAQFTGLYWVPGSPVLYAKSIQMTLSAGVGSTPPFTGLAQLESAPTDPSLTTPAGSNWLVARNNVSYVNVPTFSGDTMVLHDTSFELLVTDYLAEPSTFG